MATGRPGQFEHFLTPPGVFEHTPANMDFRAEGTRNAPGLLDAEFEAAARQGQHLWVLRADRQTTPSLGRWLVVIDSRREARPTWSPSPASRRTKADLTVTREIC